jgi:hypothetical protein
MAVQPVRRCIISRSPLGSGHFVEALQTSLSPGDQLEIIMDRRHGGSSGESGLKEDRRRQRHVALALEVNGFAIVPTSIDPPEYRATSLLRFEATIERPSPVGDDDEARLESIRSFQRQRPGTLIPKLLGILAGATLGVLVTLLAGQLPWQSLLSQGGPDRPPGQVNESVAPAPSPAPTGEPVVARTPPPARPNSELPSAGGPASTGSVSPRDAGRPTPTASREPSIASRDTSSPPKETSTSTRGGSAPANETGASPQAGTNKGSRDAGPELGATARRSPSDPPRSNQVAGVPPPGAVTSTAPSTQVAAAHRAVFVGEPVSRGWGNSYAVRLLDPAGQPMVNASVRLVAHMADGTVENIAMGALAQPGTYRGTVPTSRSTLVDLRVRVTTGDGSVEVPVKR